MILGVNSKVEEVIISIAKRNGIEKLMVFGSRVRGDYKRTSDIDLAIIGGNSAAFSLDMNEEVPTLLEFDIVSLDGSVQSELLESIKREGKLIYEKV